MRIITTITIALLAGCSNTSYLNHASVYGGLEGTNRWAPMCAYKSWDERNSERHIVGNAGLKLNLAESDRLSTSLKWSHLSCANASDKFNYDAIGIEAEYKFWLR